MRIFHSTLFNAANSKSSTYRLHDKRYRYRLFVAIKFKSYSKKKFTSYDSIILNNISPMSFHLYWIQQPHLRLFAATFQLKVSLRISSKMNPKYRRQVFNRMNSPQQDSNLFETYSSKCHVGYYTYITSEYFILELQYGFEFQNWLQHSIIYRNSNQTAKLPNMKTFFLKFQRNLHASIIPSSKHQTSNTVL